MEQERNHSNSETFSRKSGTLIRTRFIDIGTVKTAKIQIVLYKDLIDGQQEMAIRFEYEHYDNYSEVTDTKIGVLDKDELEGLIKSINMMRTSIFTSYPESYTEVNFVSRTGFKAGCFYGDRGWSFFLKLNQYDDRSHVWLQKEDSATMLDILTRSKERLALVG